MKKFILFYLYIFYQSTAFAQPLLTGAACNPLPGEKFYLHNCDTSGVSRGSAGSGITWDLTNLTIIGTDSVQFATTQSTLYTDTFPSANMASIYEGGLSSDYFIADTAQLAIVGSGNTYANLYYSDPLALLKYPMYYNTAKHDYFAFKQPDFSTYGHGHDSIIADGKGTLLLPNGTFGNILRIHTIHWETDSFDYTAPPTVVTYRYDIYSWYQPGYHHPLLSMLYDTSHTGQEHLSQVHYSLTSYIPTATTTLSPSRQQITAFPNPAGDHIAISIAEHLRTPAEITLVNILGQVVTAEHSAQQNHIINTSAIPPGAYFLNVSTESGTYRQKIYVRH